MVADINSQKIRYPWAAVAFSWLFPGGGQFYNNYYLRGVVFIFLALLLNICHFFFLISEKYPVIIAIFTNFVSFLIVYVWGCIDAFKLTKKPDEDEFNKPDYKNVWLAVFLSIILPGLGHLYIRKLKFFLLYAFLTIGVTFYFDAVLEFILHLMLRVISCVHIYILSTDNRRRIGILLYLMIIFVVVESFTNVMTPLLIDKYLMSVVWSGYGSSMGLTVKSSDKVIVNKIVYNFNQPKVNDIIAFKIPENFRFNKRFEGEIKEGIIAKNSVFVKRIIAIGGESVLIDGNKVYVNGKERNLILADISYDNQATDSNSMKPYLIFGINEAYRVPENCYFVLGDNISNSIDSRYFGAVSQNMIVGKVVKAFSPYNLTKLLYKKDD